MSVERDIGLDMVKSRRVILEQKIQICKYNSFASDHAAEKFEEITAY